MPFHSPITLRNGYVLSQPRVGRRRRYTINSPVRLNQRMSNGVVRQDRLSGRNRRRIQIGAARFTVAKGKHDAVTEQTIDVAHKQQTKHENPASGIVGAIHLTRLHRVLKVQAKKNKRFTSWRTLKRCLFEVLEVMVAGREGLFLQNSVLVIHRKQIDWTSFHDGRVPCRPLALSTLENYAKDLANHLKETKAGRGMWMELGAEWINDLVLPSCYYVFPDEFYEYA